MQPEISDSSDDNANRLRRSVHDVAAVIIAIRALAETLAEHVPTLVAVSRSKYSDSKMLMPPEKLDALPAIPAEILQLCEIARDSLRSIGNTNNVKENDQEPAPHNAPRSKQDASASAPEGDGARVLLVEDEETIRYVMSRILERNGCRVTSTSDGETALRIMEEQEFDLVLMDLRIPGKSGWEATETIRERESSQGLHTNIVGLTASPMLVDQQRAKAAGMDDVLVKPIGETELRSLLRRYTDHS
jgi:CheY-like chemotaxis protein